MKHFVINRAVLGCAAFLLSCGLSMPAGAQEPVDALREQLREMQQRMNELMKRIEAMEQEKAETDRVSLVEQSVKSIQESPSILNPSIGLAIDTTFEHHGDTDGEFKLRSVELGLAAEIDPYARAYTFITGNEDGVEIEEAAVQTTSLPVTVTAGRFFADFGRLAQFHQHELPFVNTPLSLTRMVGGESLGTGVQLNRILPTPFFLSFTGGVFNEIGHTHGAHEHGNEGGEHGNEGGEHGNEGGEHGNEGGEHGETGGSRDFRDLTWLGRLHAFFDLSETWNLEAGASVAFTPRTETGPEDSKRALFGTDVTLRHRPLTPGFYEGITIAGEWLVNRQDFHDIGRMTARGGYAYAHLDFNPEFPGKWSFGVLADSAPNLEKPSVKTLSLSPYLSWAPSEFNRLRLQYTHGQDEVGTTPSHDGAQFYLQWTTVLGSHTHGFRERH